GSSTSTPTVAPPYDCAVSSRSSRTRGGRSSCANVPGVRELVIQRTAAPPARSILGPSERDAWPAFCETSEQSPEPPALRPGEPSRTLRSLLLLSRIPIFFYLAGTGIRARSTHLCPSANSSPLGRR